MRFTQTVFALAALGTSVLAQEATNGFDAITNPSAADQQVASGSSFDITWLATTHSDETVSITLLSGADPATLQPGASPIASGLKNSVAKYTWTVAGTGAATYGFKISLDSNPTVFQYSFPFHISGGSTSSSSPASAPASSSSASSSSAAPSTLSSSSAAPTSSSSAVASSSSSSYFVPTTVAPPTASTPAANNVPYSNTTVATTLSSSSAPKTSVVGVAPTASPSGNGTTIVQNGAPGNVVAQGGMVLVGAIAFALAL